MTDKLNGRDLGLSAMVAALVRDAQRQAGRSDEYIDAVMTEAKTIIDDYDLGDVALAETLEIKGAATAIIDETIACAKAGPD